MIFFYGISSLDFIETKFYEILSIILPMWKNYLLECKNFFNNKYCDFVIVSQKGEQFIWWIHFLLLILNEHTYSLRDISSQ